MIKMEIIFMNHLRSLPVTFNKKDVEIISRETRYRGFFSIHLYRFRHRLFNGGISSKIQREIVERGNAAILLPYDPVRDEVVLIEQLRIAAIDVSLSPWLLEMVAGIISPGENIEDVCRREAREEAGIDIRRCKKMLSYLSSPGGTSERISMMVGEVDSDQAHGIHGLAKEHEDIRVHVVSRKQAYCWMTEGVIDNAASFIALQWLALHYISLRKEWGIS